MKHFFLTVLLFSIVSFSVCAQENSVEKKEKKEKYLGFKPAGGFGGTFADFTISKLGNSLAFGGGGSFLFRNGLFLGAFGQGATTILRKKSKIAGYEDYDVKTRFTGFWIGFLQKFKKNEKINISYYTKVGFGRVSLDNKKNQEIIYGQTILFSPHFEPVFQVTSFLQIGVGVFYDFYTGVNFLTYKNNDFNAFGANMSLRFGSAKYY